MTMNRRRFLMGAGAVGVSAAGLALLAGSGCLPFPAQPARHRALIEPEGGHDRLGGTPLAQERQHDGHYIHRGAQAVERRPLARTEGPPTPPTAIALLLLAMDLNVAVADSPSGGTGHVRTE